MKQTKKLVFMAVVLGLVLFTAHWSLAAYNRAGDTDSNIFRTEYPNTVGTKLDSCTTCHSGGSYTSGGKTTTLGSCQWCHYVTNYGADLSDATLFQTLNPYGLAYKNHGRNAGALPALFWPALTLGVMVLLFGLFALFEGLLAILTSFGKGDSLSIVLSSI
jgi:hypothetical protein